MLHAAKASGAKAAVRCFSSAAGAASGVLHICGTAEYNKLGFGDSQDREAPVPIPALEATPIAHVACGKYHSAAVAADGSVYAWGLEASGQLGLGSRRTKAHTPALVEALSGAGVTQLSCGSYHTLARTAEGEVYSWGFGGSFFSGAGGLGHGDRQQLETPKVVSAFGGDVRAAYVSGGGYHSLAVDREGGVWSWGRGEWGRLGFGDATDRLEPERMDEACDDLAPTVARAGEAHSACVAGDGQLYTWGRNEHWQLGYEVSGLLNSGQSFDAQQEPAPVPLPEGAGRVVDVACGELGTAVLLEDDSVWMWGMRRYFEPTLLPGSGGRDAADSGVRVEGKVAQLEVGASHVAIRTDGGRAYTFGYGTPLGLPKAQRKQWELAEVTFDGRKVLQIACGSNSTAFLVEA
mmetsp:Transcript_11579/g.37076  ORF Transcript_11579/g.37076 Transcript_11579/m.37076 type:complete len:406 (+) Transcript_11579:3-1220(+)